MPIARTPDEHGGVAGGLVSPAGEQVWHHTATVWEHGTLVPHTLASGRGSGTFATDRNENGMVVGWRMNAPGTAPTAVYWPSADAAPVGLPGQVAFEANARGRIVGIRPVPGSTAFPFTAVMWEPARDGRVLTTELGDESLGSYVNALQPRVPSLGGHSLGGHSLGENLGSVRAAGERLGRINRLTRHAPERHICPAQPRVSPLHRTSTLLAGELHDVRTEIVGLDDPGERAALTQGRDIEGRCHFCKHCPRLSIGRHRPPDDERAGATLPDEQNRPV
ncbi:hypothetical protein Q5762_27010 [Streptomyces sp. P9(2023)]|uniref:hypothetical protein n=1 Tax=Streptomyces sp. P9(2023) TaxID=3064394 RepID=UPI0028F43DCA|nr:hypothetical protein [Streptomyces sp. P9(2023)]MDT9691915.1 hypothetical protein [Streptomyces sp. P9(2023)]